MTPTSPAVRPARPRPATDAPSTGYGVDRSGNLESSRPAANIPATSPETSSPPFTLNVHRLADTLAEALPPLSNRTLSSLLRRLAGDDAIDAAARAAPRVLHGRPNDQARAAAERRHHDRAFRAAIAEQEAGGVPLTEAEQRRTFARVVVAALPPLVERIRTLCRQAPGPDRDGGRNRRVIPARHRRARHPRDEFRVPPTRRKRPAVTFTEAATTTDAPAPGRTATVNGRFRILDPERGDVLPEVNLANKAALGRYRPFRTARQAPFRASFRIAKQSSAPSSKDRLAPPRPERPVRRADVGRGRPVRQDRPVR